jgi:hypothetical protein
MKYCIPAGLISALLLVMLVAPRADAQYAIGHSVFGSGGTAISGGSNSIQGTVGQPIIGISTGPTKEAYFGFWYTHTTTVVDVDALQSDPSFIIAAPFPNPANNLVHIWCTGVVGCEIEMTITDMLGRTMARRKTIPPTVSVFDISGFTPGLYSIVARMDRQIVIRVFYVIR